MSKIRLTEAQIKYILTESAQDKAVQNFLKSKGINDYNERMKIIGELKHDIPNLRLDNGKFVLGALRMYFDRQLSNEQSIRTLDNTLKYIHSGNHTEEYNFDLNGKTLDELSNTYREISRKESTNDRERSNNTVFNGRTNYRIIPINSFEEAEPYGRYTSWCVTHGEEAFESYTKAGKRFYFCLKNGFESIQKNDEGAPLNEWGLSMIAVNVDMEGNLTRITTRYNHDFNGENNTGLETTEQLEKVLNVPFYQTFKPYTRDELHKMGIISFDEAQELLNNGEDPDDIFDDVGFFYKGFAIVGLNDKWNFINTDGQILSDIWFDDIDYYFVNGFAKVKLNDKWNFINTDGQILSDIWFDDIDYYFVNGFARVKLNDKWNFINTDGQILSDIWFDYVDFFYNGFTTVGLNDKWNLINTDGQLFDPVTKNPVKLNENRMNKNHKIRLTEAQFREYMRMKLNENKKTHKTIRINEEVLKKIIKRTLKNK